MDRVRAVSEEHGIARSRIIVEAAHYGLDYIRELYEAGTRPQTGHGDHVEVARPQTDNGEYAETSDPAEIPGLSEDQDIQDVSPEMDVAQDQGVAQDQDLLEPSEPDMETVPDMEAVGDDGLRLM